MVLSSAFSFVSCSAEELHNPPLASSTQQWESTNRPNSSDEIRQTDAAGHTLPFVTNFRNRWSDLNDGSTYEPCTALTDIELSKLGVDPLSVRDSAVANHQTARGCRWNLLSSRTSLAYQDVGNGPPLVQYKYKTSSLIDWYQNVEIGGRTVAVGVRKRQPSCTTHVQSGRAIVTTSISIPVNSPGLDQICAKAIAFTKATIDKMPP